MNSRLKLFKPATPFRHVNPAYLQFKRFAADIDTCVEDWFRDVKNSTMFVNSHDAYGLLERLDFFVTKDPKALISFWKESLIENVVLTEDVSEKKVMSENLLNFMKEFFHQGGFYALLQATLYEHLIKLGYMQDHQCSRRNVNFVAKRNRIEVEEVVEIDKLMLMQKAGEFITAENTKNALMRGKLTHHITIDTKGKITHQIDSVIVEYESAKALVLFDTGADTRRLIAEKAKIVSSKSVSKLTHSEQDYKVAVTPRNAKR